jgi:hypothetical protein
MLPLKYFKFVQGNASKGQLEINRDSSDHTREKRKLDRVFEQVRLLFTALTNLDLQAFGLFLPTHTESRRCFRFQCQYGLRLHQCSKIRRPARGADRASGKLRGGACHVATRCLKGWGGGGRCVRRVATRCLKIIIAL